MFQELPYDILAGPASARNTEEVPLIDFARIKKATNNFNQSNKLGSGGLGTVYEVTFGSKHILKLYQFT